MQLYVQSAAVLSDCTRPVYVFIISDLLHHVFRGEISNLTCLLLLCPVPVVAVRLCCVPSDRIMLLS